MIIFRLHRIDGVSGRLLERKAGQTGDPAPTHRLPTRRTDSRLGPVAARPLPLPFPFSIQPFPLRLDLMEHAGVVLTDSGGIQEETTFLGVPCLTLRENTERPATLTSGTNELVFRGDRHWP